jgi:hypothetical protein
LSVGNNKAEQKNNLSSRAISILLIQILFTDKEEPQFNNFTPAFCSKTSTNVGQIKRYFKHCELLQPIIILLFLQITGLDI